MHLVANNVVFYLEHPEQRESYTNVERHATVFFQKNQKNQKNQRLTTGVKTPWLTRRETPFGRLAPLFVSVKGAGIKIGGWPNEKTETTPWSIEIPYALSILAFSDPHAEVKGLKAFPKDRRPPVAVVHFAFQIMVFLGFWMMFVAAFGGFLAWRDRRLPDQTWWLKIVAWSGPSGILAIQAGWTVTEVGRQPWIINGVMRTKDAVTPMPGLIVPFLTFSLLYAVLGVVVIFLLKRQVFQSPSFASLQPAASEANPTAQSVSSKDTDTQQGA